MLGPVYPSLPRCTQQDGLTELLAPSVLNTQVCLKLVSLPMHGKPTGLYQVWHMLNPQEHSKHVGSCTC